MRGILFRKVQNGDEEVAQLVLPKTYKEDVLRGLHNDVWHPGIEKKRSVCSERDFSGLVCSATLSSG